MTDRGLILSSDRSNQVIRPVYGDLSGSFVKIIICVTFSAAD